MSDALPPLLPDEVADARRLTALFLDDFALFDEIYDLALKYLSNANVRTHEADKVLASALLFRALESARSLRILAALGLTADASVCARSLMEALAKLANAAKDPGFLRKFDSASLVDRLRLHHVMRKRPEDRHLSKDDVFEDLQKLVAEQGAEKLPKVEALLGNVGLSSAYDFAYRLQSGDAHVTADSLWRYFVTNAEGEFTGLRQYPHDKEIPTVVGGGAVSVLASLVAWGDVVGVNITERGALERKIAALSAKQKGKTAAAGGE